MPYIDSHSAPTELRFHDLEGQVPEGTYTFNIVGTGTKNNDEFGKTDPIVQLTVEVKCKEYHFELDESPKLW